MPKLTGDMKCIFCIFVALIEKSFMAFANPHEVYRLFQQE